MPRRMALALLHLALASAAPRAASAPAPSAASAAAAAAGCSRERPCANYGSCELHTGSCACPLGFGGRLCDTVLLGACALTATPPPGRPPAMLCASGSGVPEHGQVGLLSCDCLRQCVAHEAGGLATHGPCYERPGGPDAQLSAFPGEDEAGVVYRMSSAAAQDAPVSREKYMEHQVAANRLPEWRALPLRDCNASCSFEGVCLRDPQGEHRAQCWCHYGFAGDACDEPLPAACLNACAGHGTCMRGFCSCDMGWFGIDCSIDLNATASLGLDPVVELDMPEGDADLVGLRAAAGGGTGARALEVPPGTVQQRLRPAIYVYELPTWLAQAFEIDRLAHQTERGMYAAYWPFFSNLLADSHVRTHDPWKANLFYIPAFTYAVSSNGSPPHDYIRRVLRFIKAEYPALWARRGGRDHIVWAPGDRGVCPLPPDLAPLIWLVHFGQEHVSADGGNVADPMNATQAPGSCFDPQRGIVAPPLVQDAASLANATYGPGAQSETERPTLLFFAGGTRMASLEYSQGVRQQVWTLYHNRTADGYQIHEHVSDMGGDMRRSRFCLAPSGHGWGIRIVHAVAAGCIPVVIQDGVHQPYDDVLPYDAFSLRLPSSDVANLDAVLRGVSDAELRALQAGLRRFHRAFLWAPAMPDADAYPGEAYQWLIKSLHRRLHNILAGFGRPAEISAAA